MGAASSVQTRPETQEFFSKLGDFLAARDEVNAAASKIMPENKMVTFDSNESKEIHQELCANESTDDQLGLLYERARETKPLFDEICKEIVCEATDLKPEQEMLRQHREDGTNKVFYVYSEAPLKGDTRAREKVEKEYGGDASKLVDIVRGSLVVDSEVYLLAIVEFVLNKYADKIVRFKNRFKYPTFNGYRDALFNLVINGHICELQVHLKQMIEFKAKTHVFYEYFRTYFSGNLDEVAERMKALEKVMRSGNISEASRILEDALQSNDEIKLRAIADLLEKLSECTLLQRIRERILVIVEEKYGGKESTQYATCLNKLASLLKNQGKYDEAKPFYERALRVREECLGPNHPDVATTLNSLAWLLVEQGKYDEAKPLFQRAIGIWEKAHGPNHPQVAVGLNNLAGLLRDQGKYDDAKPLFERAIEIWEKVHGPNHPHVATGLNNLALLLKNQGKYDEAKPLFQRAIGIWEKAHGPNHPRVAIGLNNLAGLLEKQGKYDEAKPLYERAIEIGEKTLGPNHPLVASALNNLAGLLRDQGKYDEAKPLYERALKIGEKTLGPNHPRVAQSLNGLAALLKDQAKYDEAKPLCERALRIREEKLGPNHPDVATTLHNLAGLLQDQKKYKEARPLVRRALDIHMAKLPPEHPDIARSRRLLETTDDLRHQATISEKKRKETQIPFHPKMKRWIEAKGKTKDQEERRKEKRNKRRNEKRIKGEMKEEIRSKLRRNKY